MTDELVNAVQIYFDIKENRRLLKSLLIHYLHGESDWVRQLPENAKFLRDLRRKGIDDQAWLSADEQTFSMSPKGRKQVTLYFETPQKKDLQCIHCKSL